MTRRGCQQSADRKYRKSAIQQITNLRYAMRFEQHCRAYGRAIGPAEILLEYRRSSSCV
jgi:hypothetical protein